MAWDFGYLLVGSHVHGTKVSGNWQPPKRRNVLILKIKLDKSQSYRDNSIIKVSHRCAIGIVLKGSVYLSEGAKAM